VHVKTVIIPQLKRQFRQETPLLRAQPAAGPLDRGLGLRIHGFRWGADGVVVVAAHGHGAIIDEAHHRLDGPFRIGAITDVIAEANHPFRATRPRKIEARAECLPVGVNIRKNGQQHAFLHTHPIGRACTGFDGYQTIQRRPQSG